MKKLYISLLIIATGIYASTAPLQGMKIEAGDEPGENLKIERRVYEDLLSEAQEVGNPIAARYWRKKLDAVSARLFNLANPG